jgi:hypothetical protein
LPSKTLRGCQEDLGRDFSGKARERKGIWEDLGKISGKPLRREKPRRVANPAEV